MAVVTGASRGVGAGVARRLSDDGYDVWSLSRSPADDPRVHHLACDLADPASARAATERLIAAVGGIDLLVPNSAVRSLGPVAAVGEADWRDAVEVNLTSVVLLVQRTLPLLRARRGRIVVMGSHAGSYWFEGGLAYCATKAALKALVEVLLLEERPHGVLTTLLSPGAVANEAGDPGDHKLAVASVAEAVSWVARTPADLVVGEMEFRPASLPHKPVSGFDRLQVI